MKHATIGTMAVLFALIVLVGLGLFVLGVTRNNQIQACHRGNVIRRESDQRITQHVNDVRALEIFAKATGQARWREYRRTHNPEDRTVALAANRALALDRHVRFFHEPQVDCARVIHLIP